jgi:hypothetical protein
MYSTTPLPDPNQGHVGFYFAIVGLLLLGIISFLVSIDDHERSENSHNPWSLKNSPTFTAFLVIYFILFCMSFYGSFIDTKPVPKNEVVIAGLVDLDTKMVQKNFGSTKHPEWRSVQQGFLVYKTPDGYLTLPNNHLQVVHPRVILYKN